MKAYKSMEAFFVSGCFINFWQSGHCTHKHDPNRLLPTADAGLQATFSCVFQSISFIFHLMNTTFWYTIKAPCGFSVWSIWATINNAKHRHLIVLHTWKSLPALHLHFTHSTQWRDVMCKKTIDAIRTRVQTADKNITIIHK